MVSRLRAAVLAMAVFTAPPAAWGQTQTVLHIKVVLVSDDGKAMPVPRHALLISENPASAVPRRVVTGLDGTVDVRLRPGNYTVESDRPVAFQGKAYQWTQTLDVLASDVVLELTAANAETGAAAAANADAPAPLGSDASFLLPQWQDSVVAIWTPLAHASGFVIDPKGLIATNQRAVGTATSVEMQVTPVVKVAATVLATDAERDAAILWIDPATVASVRPVPLACGQPLPATAESGQRIVSLGVSLHQQKEIESGTVSKVGTHRIASDLELTRDSVGGPVFTADGGFVGLTSVEDDRDEGRRRARSQIVAKGDVCDVVAAALNKTTGAAPPSGTHLPVEPDWPLPLDALKTLAQRRVGSLNPYQISSSGFDVAFITPVMTYGAQYQAEQVNRQGRGAGASSSARVVQPAMPPILEFANWAEYVGDFPPVLLVRITPKLVEGFWSKVARGAAMTQGAALPAFKRIESGFSRMRAYCGDTEVTPIHPFKLEHRVSDNDAIYEGLYAFDPNALGPQCGTVKLVLFSEKEPEKGDSRVVDGAVVQQIWQDFAPYRER